METKTGGMSPCRPFDQGRSPELFRGSSSFCSVGDLLSLFSCTLLSALAGLCLFRVVLGFALCKAGFVQEAQNAVGRLCALIEPMLDAVGVELDAGIVVLGEHRVPGTEVLEEAAIARRTGVGENDVVVRALLGTTECETNFQCHFLYSLDVSEPLFLEAALLLCSSAVFGVVRCDLLMMPDDFLDDEVQALLGEIRLQIGILGQVATAFDLV